ncbi:hypothetical protein LJC52_02130 [Bacteroidales bacterium OttesenSCG-928-A17]|nr:hypothetical protein [Bacteroidales bacterium OttesenSCG-928-A17]
MGFPNNKDKHKIMMKTKYKFTVDAFTACYLADEAVIKFLNDITYKDDFYYEFKLHRIEGAGMIHDNVIHVLVQNPNSMDYMLFGKLCYSEKRKDEHENTYIWFYVNNEVFYTPFYKDYNILTFLKFTTEELCLVDNNITTLDIAFDSNVNLAKRIKKAIYNKNLIPIVNRKAYDNEREQIKGVRFDYGCNQLRLLDVALYIKQATKDGGFELKGYDKTNELESSHKEYIKDWLQMKKAYRLEIHLKKEHLQEFYESNPRLQRIFGKEIPKLLPSMILPSLSDSNDDLLAELFLEYANRLIRFKDKTTGKILSIFEV